jgi:hypothetical protein
LHLTNTIHICVFGAWRYCGSACFPYAMENGEVIFTSRLTLTMFLV